MCQLACPRTISRLVRNPSLNLRVTSFFIVSFDSPCLLVSIHCDLHIARPGGGLYIQGARSVTISNSAFTGLTSAMEGGGIVITASQQGSVSLSGCTFSGLTSYTRGGALDIEGPLSVQIMSCVFHECYASSAGPAIYFDCGAATACSLGVTSSNFTANSGAPDSTGTVMALGNVNSIFYSCIFSDNLATTGSAVGRGGGGEGHHGGWVSSSTSYPLPLPPLPS